MAIARKKMKGFLSVCLISGFGLLELGILACILKTYDLWAGKDLFFGATILLALFVIGAHIFNVYLADKVSTVAEKWLKKDE